MTQGSTSHVVDNQLVEDFGSFVTDDGEYGSRAGFSAGGEGAARASTLQDTSSGVSSWSVADSTALLPPPPSFVSYSGSSSSSSSSSFDLGESTGHFSSGVENNNNDDDEAPPIFVVAATHIPG
jgi:hypothetical protein